MLVQPSSELDIFSPGRRRIIQGMAAATACITAPAFSQQRDFWSLPRELWLKRPSEKGKRWEEEVREVYWANGQLVVDGYLKICKILRDVQANEAVQFDLVTLDIARGVYGWLQAHDMKRPLIVNSGYRNPKTNATEGGKLNSLHTKAQALDLRIDGVSPKALADFGRYLAGGGVGYYPGKGFTHLDRGKIKYWRG